MKFLNNIDLQKNELQNPRLQNLAAAPSNPVEGQFYWNTQSKLMYMYNGTEWVDVGSTYELQPATASTLGGVMIGSNIGVTTSGTISVSDASSSVKGVIRIATDSEITTGTSEALAVNPKQLKSAITTATTGLIKLTDISAEAPITYDNTTGVISASYDSVPTASSNNLMKSKDIKTAIDNKVTKNNAITGATHTKITYDSKGLVTGGADLTKADIPALDYLPNTTTIEDLASDDQMAAIDSGITEDDVAQIETNRQAIATINTTLSGYGDIVTHNVSEFATAAQGALADSALQSGDNISELVNDENYIKLTSISATSPIAYSSTTGVISVASGYQIPTTTQVGKIDTALQATDIVDNLSSTATNKALSANQGKQINDRLSSVESRGRFLSSWNCTTGKPATDPETLPYAYRTGDYYIVDQVASAGGTNYRPSGSSYTGAASTAVETEEVVPNSTYLYDGTKWILQIGSAQTVTFSSIAGSPYDNSNLTSALDAKVTGNNAITGGTHTKITYDSKGLVTGGADLTADDIPDLAYLPDTTTINDLLPAQSGNANKVLGTNGTSASWVTVVRKLTATNPALTPSSGTCTWTVSNTLGNADVEVTLKEASTNEEVYANVVTTASSVTFRINSASTIAAGTYKAIILG